MYPSQSQHNSCFENVLQGIYFITYHCLASISCAFPSKVLLSAGADLEATDNDGRTALMLTTAKGHSQVAKVRNPMCSRHNHNINPFFIRYLSIRFTTYQTFAVLFSKR